MNPDDPVCLCFHVSRRKVVNFIRVEKPRRPSQLSECWGAGTGCGWCRPYLERLLRESQQDAPAVAEDQAEPAAESLDDLTSEDYARRRAQHIRDTGATLPPGAEPPPAE